MVGCSYKFFPALKNIQNVISARASINSIEPLPPFGANIICSWKPNVLRALLSENCCISVRGQMSVYVFAPNAGYCLFIHHTFIFARLYWLLRHMVKITGKLWRCNVDICPPIISVEKKQRQRKKSAQEFYFLIFITLHEKKGLLL